MAPYIFMIHWDLIMLRAAVSVCGVIWRSLQKERGLKRKNWCWSKSYQVSCLMAASLWECYSLFTPPCHAPPVCLSVSFSPSSSSNMMETSSNSSNRWTGGRISLKPLFLRSGSPLYPSPLCSCPSVLYLSSLYLSSLSSSSLYLSSPSSASLISITLFHSDC